MDSESTITDGGLIVTSYQFIDKIPYDRIPYGSKLVFLVLHRHHIFRCLLFGAAYKSNIGRMARNLLQLVEFVGIHRTRKFLNHLDAEGSLVFFSKDSQSEINHSLQTDLSADTRLLPYPRTQQFDKVRKFDVNHLILCWVGRLDHDMIDPLMNTLDLLESERSFISATEITLKVFGDGDSIQRLQNRVSKGIHIEFMGVLFGRDLHEYLAKYVDIGIGRGRVCLDFINQGIPFVNIPLQFADKENAIFTHGYDGYERDVPRYRISEILYEIMSNYEMCRNRSQLRMEDYSIDKFCHHILDDHIVKGTDPIICDEYVRRQSVYMRLKDFLNRRNS